VEPIPRTEKIVLYYQLVTLSVKWSSYFVLQSVGTNAILYGRKFMLQPLRRYNVLEHSKMRNFTLDAVAHSTTAPTLHTA
jgi:hypothetical protein